MSKLDELIKELCPDGVEYKRLGEIGTLIRGNGLQKKDFTKSGVGCIHYGQIYTHYGVYAKQTISFVSEQTAKKLKKVEPGDLIITSTSENVEDVCKCVAWIGKESIVTGGHAMIFKHHENPKYLSYFFQSSQFFKQKVKMAIGVKVMDVSPQKLEKTLVPIPPLEVQSEIVKILDNFTELTTELTDKLSEELTARKKQYEYYRNQLLTFPLNIPMVKLKDIAIDMYRGSGIKRDQVTDEGVPCVRYGEIYTTYNIWFDKCVSHTNPKYVVNPKYFDYGDILFAITGESVGDIAKSVAYLGNKRCLAGGDIVVMKHNQNPKYLAYVLSTDLSKFQKSKGRIKSKVVHTNIPALAEIQVPLPPLPIQERIVNVLDNFDKVCNDLHIGLPAEIEARKKQYEFYRDSLLTFLEKGESILTDRQTDRQN